MLHSALTYVQGRNGPTLVVLCGGDPASPTVHIGARFPAEIARRLLVFGAVTLSLLSSGCMQKGRSQPLTNDAYVWQRHWNNAVVTALRESAPAIRAWRVLAAEADANANLTDIFINRQAVREIAKPVVAVIRINGRPGTTPLAKRLAAESAALIADWKKDGIPVLGLEIDYDCATDRLGWYRDFLRLLRLQMGRGMVLSITDLPSWMGSGDLPSLLAEVDETVLQVHSVMSPQKGLFDRTTAHRWAQAWSRLSPVPFRLALPTYWSRVSWNDVGQVASIESETARYGTDSVARELVVDPLAVSSLVAELRRTPPSHLLGFAWFRLPTAEDRRAWTPGTWQRCHARTGSADGSARRAFRNGGDRRHKCEFKRRLSKQWRRSRYETSGRGVRFGARMRAGRCPAALQLRAKER